VSGRLRTLSLLLIASLAIAGVVAIGSPAAAGGAPVRYRDVLFPGAPTVQSNIQYGAAAPLVLDVYRPLNDPAPTNRAAIVWIHGGGFAGGKRTSDSMIGFATQFAQRGYVTASIDYRVRPGLVCTYGVGTMPQDCLDAARDAQHDAQAAVRWLRANATTFGVDPARIIVAGNSAGGITAMNVNYNSEDPGSSGNPGQPSTVSAGVALAGCTQPPSTIGPGEPPTQLIHGSLDPVVPYNCAVTTRNAALAAGDHSELFTVQESPPGNHGVTNNPTAQSPRISTFLYNRVIAPSTPTRTLSVADVLVSEGNSGTKNAVFAVSLSAASTSTVTVSYATANGTAAAPGDYAAKTGTLTFTPGQTAKTVTVLVNGDTAVEPDEVFTLNLTGPTGATLGDGTATGTIQNNDVVAPASSLSITDVTKAEGPKGTTTSFTFKVTLSAARSASTTVRVATANGTATTAGLDYTAKTATVTIPAGVVTKNFTVKVTGDRKIEANETFVVNLSNPTGATIADAQGLGTITNDD
jgi:dienelactone hydrolase